MNSAASCEVIGDGCPLLSGVKSGLHELRPIESRNWRSACSQPTITECCCSNIAAVPRDPTIIQLESIFTVPAGTAVECTSSDTVTACVPANWLLGILYLPGPLTDSRPNVSASSHSPEARTWSKPDNSLQFSSQQQRAKQQSSAHQRFRPNNSISAYRLVYVFFRVRVTKSQSGPACPGRPGQWHLEDPAREPGRSVKCYRYTDLHYLRQLLPATPSNAADPFCFVVFCFLSSVTVRRAKSCR